MTNVQTTELVRKSMMQSRSSLNYKVFYFEGFMCGKCLPSEGLALNLSDCLQCQASDVILFILFCKLAKYIILL